MFDLVVGVRLKADGSGLVGEVRLSSRELEKLNQTAKSGGRDMDLFGRAAGRAQQEMHRLNESGKNVLRNLTSLKAMLAGLGVGLVAKSFLDAASTSEQYAVRLRVLLGSVEEARRLFKEMNEYAREAPFTFEEVMGAATQLAGIMKGGVDEIKAWMPLIGDLAGTSGLSIELATEQFVRMFSAGAAAADTFREKGITGMLGFQSGVIYSAEETRQKLWEAWTKTDSQFHGAVELLKGTWAGGMSMLEDKWFEFRNQVMGAGLFDYLKAVVRVVDKELGGALSGNEKAAKQWSDTIILGIESIAIGSAQLVDELEKPLGAVKAAASELWDGFRSLPSWAQEVGVVGAVVGGTKFRLVILGLAAMSAEMKKVQQTIDEVTGDADKNPAVLGALFGSDSGGAGGLDNQLGQAEARIRAFFQAVRAEMAAGAGAPPPGAPPGSAPGGGGSSLDAAQVKALNSSFEQQRESLLTQEDQLQVSYSKRAAIIESALALQGHNQITSTQEVSALLEQLEQEHMAKLLNIRSKGLIDMERFNRASWRDQALATAQYMSGITATVATGNKFMFELHKVAALSEGVLNLRSAVMGAYKVGAEIGGPPLGAAFAAVAGLAQAANLAQIASAQYGGNQGGGASGGGGAAAVPVFNANPITGQPAAAQSAQDRGTVQVIFQGDIYGWDSYIQDKVMSSIKDAISNRDMVIITKNSRQAQELTN